MPGQVVGSSLFAGEEAFECTATASVARIKSSEQVVQGEDPRSGLAVGPPPGTYDLDRRGSGP